MLHNGDTSMRVLRLAREPSDDRTGVFTSDIRVHTTRTPDRLVLHRPSARRRESADVLQHRAADVNARPLQMCDALSRNTPKLSDGAVILLANCLVHGRRQFVEGRRELPRTLPLCSGGAGATSINMMRRRASTIYRQPSGSSFISSTAAR